MPSSNPSNASIRWIILYAIILCAIIIPILKYLKPAPVAKPPSTQPLASQPASLPATRPVIKDFMRLVSINYPQFPATQPLNNSIDLSESAHLIFKYPLTVDAHGDLWILHDDGADPADAVKKPAQVNIVNRKVLFSHRWRYPGSSRWKYGLVVPSKTRVDLVDEDQTRPIAKVGAHDWSRTLSLDDGKIAVPTPNGISIFSIPPRGAISESVSPPLLADPSPDHAPVQIILFNNSLIFWIPPTPTHPGSPGAIRWIDRSWKKLQGDSWPDHLVLLIPLYDSVIQLIGSADSARISTVSMENAAAISQEDLTKKILQLDDPDPDLRDAAERQLALYRDTLWPIAEKLMETVSPEIQIRLQNLLRARDFPMLGNCQPKDGKVQIHSLLPGGGCLFYNPQGALIPNGADEPTQVKPAWILSMPGSSIRIIQGEFLNDLDPAIHQLKLAPSGAWIAQDPKTGVRMLLAGNNWLKLTRKGEEAFTLFENIDAQGRLILRTPDGAAGPTLLIDPRLPDIRPRLPIWSAQYQSVGWDKNNLPALTLQENPMVLEEDKWTLIDKKTNAFITDPNELPALADTWPAQLGKPLAKDDKGNLYFDGTSRIVILTPAGEQIDLPLPADAVGAIDKPSLVLFGNDRIFLYNKPGQISRLRLAARHLSLDANFTQNAPDAKELIRMWLDPQKRLVMIWEKKMALAFPEGYIPKPTRLLIPAAAMPKNDDL